MFMTAAYRLKQRRKRLTHRAQGSDTFGLFRRCVARLAQERRVALSIKVRRELDGALGRSGRGVVELRLKGCDLTDAVVELLCEGLEQHPAVGKVDVRGNGALKSPEAPPRTVVSAAAPPKVEHRSCTIHPRRPVFC